MVMDDNESCSSRVAESSRHQRKKVEVYNEVLRRLKESHHPEVETAAFDDELWAHFNRLPTRYALDVNVERAEDVLAHKRLLHLAQDPANRPAFDVRLVQVSPTSDGNLTNDSPSSSPKKEAYIHHLLLVLLLILRHLHLKQASVRMKVQNVQQILIPRFRGPCMKLRSQWMTNQNS